MRPDAEEPQPVNPHTVSPVQPITPGLSSSLFNHSMSTPIGMRQAAKVNPHGSVGLNGAALPYKYVGGSTSGPKAAVNPFNGPSPVGESPFDAGKTSSAFEDVTSRSAAGSELPHGDQDQADEPNEPTGEPGGGESPRGGLYGTEYDL